ncbi:MAG: carboxypeptidase regulatory-like domain-containing protein [Terriglobales bacterium]
MTRIARCGLLAVLFSLALASAGAQNSTLTGTVTNGTTNKPAAGDEVILINLANGMDVAGSTKTDSAGKFSFKVSVPGPHLIRAVHQGVNYHQMAPPGTNTADVSVYDVATKVSDLSVTADVMRFQADGGTMQGVRLFVVSNTSSPAKTQMNDHNFEFYLPAGAKVEQVQARSPNGQPIPAEAVPQSDKNRYALAFPLRPGETQFQVEFTLPYSGDIKIDPKPLYPSSHLVIVLPKTMQFTAANASTYQSMQDPNQGDSNVEVAQQTKPGQPLGFTLKGSGVINETPAETASGAAQQEQQPQGRDGRPMPGGGLGAPIDAPDALQQYRWPILGAFALLLAFGGWVVTKRQGGSAVVAPSSAGSVAASSNQGVAGSRKSPNLANSAASIPAPAPRSAMLLDALKEELFQLEVEKKQGKITPEDYEKAKAALDQTLDRALKRQG